MRHEPMIRTTFVDCGAVGECDHGAWDLEKLAEWVDEGLAVAAERGAPRYHAAEIHYVRNDTPSHELAARCGYEIARRFAAGWNEA